VTQENNIKERRNSKKYLEMVNTKSLGFLLLLALGAVAGAPVELEEIEESYDRFQAGSHRDALAMVKHARHLIAQIEGSVENGRPLPENLQTMLRSVRERVSKQIGVLYGSELDKYLSDYRPHQRTLQSVFTPEFLRNYRNERPSGSRFSSGLVQILADNVKASNKVISGEQLLEKCETFIQGIKDWFEEVEHLSDISPAEVRRASEIGHHRDEVEIISICRTFLYEGLPRGLETVSSSGEGSTSSLYR